MFRPILLCVLTTLPQTGPARVSEAAQYRQQVRQDARQELVDLAQFIPGLRLDIRYATPHNLTGQRIYPEAAAFLRRPVAEDLRRVQQTLARQGYALKIYDAYRPYAATVRLYEALPDQTYAAPPTRGSKHNRGCSVDLGLIDLKTGRDVALPTDFDAMTPAAHSDYQQLPAAALRHRAILHQAMQQHGFRNYPAEWWHFDHQGWEQYPLLDLPFSALR
ncbi:M15 family metallopeptidase [Hymenobacter jeollabukensis]|uniref:D-alanyl-D-alanine dipeptidase n=1 Tax=Hymenobacter jeollabukensis TaxID=2025313 RepID=A0A5R8WMI2_9BACT|nr:M15 family metallopeptidase [Hymenobacter jeollabukensis]TLM90099.1 D-alanyl-D-alanine dipeptidase [Hymenobacter jeollabukensis]